MPTPSVLEHYLVSLSMKGPGATEQREAEKAFAALAEAVAVIVPTITAAATAIVYATDKIAAGLSRLYFESQKTGATVRELAALGYAFEQNGSTLEKFHADFDKFAQTLRDFPAYKKLLRDKLGLKPEDFKDDLATYSATLKALAAKRAAGDTQSEGAYRKLFGLDEDNIIARGRKDFDKFYAEGFARNKGIDENAAKALALVRSLNAFGAALEAVGRRTAAALFDKYGLVLDDMTTWVDDHSDEIVAVVIEVVDQLVLAYRDIEPIAVPAVRLIAAGLDSTAAALDRLLGSPDGQHGGLHAVRYVLDALAAYIAGRWALRLAGLLGIRALIRLLPGGAVFLGAYEGAQAFAGDPGHALGGSGYDAAGRLLSPGMGPTQAEGAPGRGGRFGRGGSRAGRASNDGAESADKTASGDVTPPPPPPPEGSGNPADFAEQLDNLHDHDPDGHAKIMEFLRSGGHGMDPATSDWCASFVGAALHKAGYRDIPQVRGGDVANAYQDWGVGVEAKDVRRGDVVITTRGRRPGQMGGHVSIASGPMVNGKIPVIEGDTRASDWSPGHPRHQVGRDWEEDRPGLMYRRGISPEPLATPAPIQEVPKAEVPKPQSLLQLPNDLHSKLASLSSAHQIRNKWTKTNNIGSRKQVTNIQLASTDPHTAASEISRHMKSIHAGTLRSLDRLA